MVRISVDLVNNAYQFINPVKQRELSLRNLQIPSIENLGVTKDQFDVIDLSDNNVRKLNNLPLLKRLEVILLHNNRIQQIEKTIGEHLPNLKTLALTNNNIAEFGDIDPLAKCHHLEYLTLIGNPLTHKQHYRQYVIYKLKTVRVLDFRRVKLEERKAAKKLFKGASGETLRLDIVRESAPLRDDEEHAAAVGAEALKSRPAEEQKKIKELISSAKTLTEVENLHSMLQSGRIPTNGHGGSGLDEEDDAMDDDRNEYDNNGVVPMETTAVADEPEIVVEAAVEPEIVVESEAESNGAAEEPPIASQTSMSGMEMEDEDDD